MQKVELNPLVFPESSLVIPERESLKDEYLLCLSLEKKSFGDLDPQQFKESLRIERENLGITLLNIYRSSPSLEWFMGYLKGVMQESEEAKEYVLYPSNIREGLKATVNNLRVASRIARVASSNSEGILMSGSNAWGTFFAVRGNMQGRLNLWQEENVSKREGPSDIDLMIAHPKVEGLKAVVQGLVADGLASKGEIKRFDVFEKIYEKQADIFSARMNVNGVEVSLHFVSSAIVEKMSNPAYSQRMISYIRDFRPNTSGEVRREGGYKMYDLKGAKTFDFHPRVEEVKDPITQATLGYISDSPLGGFVKVGKKQTYYMGILPFFLLVVPAILHDPKGNLGDAHVRLRDQIRLVMNGQPAINIPRQEDMPDFILKKLKIYFS